MATLRHITGARGTDLPPPSPFFSNFLFTNLFSIKFLYFFIISSLFPYFNLFVSIFIHSYVNIKCMCRPYIDTNNPLVKMSRADFNPWLSKMVSFQSDKYFWLRHFLSIKPNLLLLYHILLSWMLKMFNSLLTDEYQDALCVKWRFLLHKKASFNKGNSVVRFSNL